ncbi:uncharacterized protein LOC122194705 [Lactuca sativa]|uniref:uncharacterized protein LOC122194705 n=1 Tax=Lactuca sativa TaxID=4236 RepID=UPI001C6931C7|nr:uncharacterized protein LOC122194705 [Lactuca sativa]
MKVDVVPEGPPPVNDDAFPVGRSEVISKAYDLFQIYKRIFVDLILAFEDRDSSQSYFKRLKSCEAFSVIEIELGFAYDMLYTKASVVYTFVGFLCRVTSVILVVMVLVGFSFLCDRDDYRITDIVITYLLIATAFIMEIFAAITMLRSDWTDHWLSQKNYTRNILIFPFLKNPSKPRWCNCIGQLDLLSVSLEEKPPSFLQAQKLLGIDKYRTKHRYKTYSEVSDKLKDLINRQFLDFMKDNTDPKSLCSHKGLCYYSEPDDDKDEADSDVCRTESKHISDYLLYLLTTYPVMLPIGIGMIRYRDTCAEATRFFKEKEPINGKVEASRKLLEVKCTELPPYKVKGDRSKSALFDGCRLALTLRNMEKKEMWKVMSQVWIEILAYAATHCRGFQHEQQLRKGGEFLTHVWLLMAHLGITEQLQVSQGHARARFNVS